MGIPRMRGRIGRLGAGLVLAAILTGAAGAQPLPIARPGTSPVAAADDPLGALVDRVSREQVGAVVTPVVIGLRLSEEAGRTRFVVELSDPVSAETFALVNPNRIVVDLPEVMWRIPDAARPSGRSAVKSYRYGLFRQGNSRFVIDLNSPVRASKPQLLPPEGAQGFRLVVDLLPTTNEAFAASAGWPRENRIAAPATTRLDPPPLNAGAGSAPGKRIIVLDPGHGGIDPGTHGASGVQEKDLVLQVARRVRTALEATGRYKVHLTRDKDIFIPLKERVTIARRAKADLFVSLHADSNDHSEVRGASVYTLSESASDREAAKLAEKENMSDVIAGVDLSSEDTPVASILIDLAQRDTMNRSVRFAETLVSTLPRATTVRPTTPHRSAGFAVLKGPDVPAVLLELGYLTNKADEAVMITDAWRGRVAQAVGSAIDRHFAGDTAPSIRRAAN